MLQENGAIGRASEYQKGEWNAMESMVAKWIEEELAARAAAAKAEAEERAYVQFVKKVHGNGRPFSFLVEALEIRPAEIRKLVGFE